MSVRVLAIASRALEGITAAFEKSAKLPHPVIDNIHGWGNTPNGAEISYRGLKVYMRPTKFLQLAAYISPASLADNDAMVQHLASGGSIGAPFLRLELPESWETGSYTGAPVVIGHEGRHRMSAVHKVWGDIPVETHLFLQSTKREWRSRHITKDLISALQRSPIFPEKRSTAVKGDWFSMQP